MNIILKARANKTIKYIKYLQKKGFEYLIDEEGNAINIKSATNEMIECWQHRPVEIRVNGKDGIYYKGKKYYLGSDK